MKKFPRAVLDAVLYIVLCAVFILSAIFLGGGFSWEGFKTGIEPAWRIAVVLGGFYALMLAVRRAKAADDQASAAMEQAVISSRSNQAQRYEKAAEMLWHPEEVGIREAGCYAMKSLGGHDVDMAVQCRDLLVSFIRHSSPTPKQKAEGQELQYRLDILAADHVLSSLYRKWHGQDKFTTFSLKYLPNGFWRIAEPISRRDYRGARLSEANLSGAHLSAANLSGAALSEANLSGAHLVRANLSGAYLSEANLSGAQLIWADLSGAYLFHADLNGAALFWAVLSGANISRAKLNEANLEGVYLSKAELNRANLINAKLSLADLSGAQLVGADFSRADLSGADLSGANISKADFKGDSKEDGAKNLTKEQIESAVWDRKFGPPLLPDYLSNVDVDKMGHPRGSTSSSG